MRVALIACIAASAVAGAVMNTSGPAEARGASTSRACLPGSLKATLATIERKFGPVVVISTHRPGALVAGSGRRSRHANCGAVDFRPANGSYKAVVAWLRSNHRGGLGTYSCGMSHIHIDNGPNYRWHNCARGKGRGASKTRRARRR